MSLKMALKSAEFEVFGTVQGVFFRKYTQRKAKELHIRGWCMNTYQETVVGKLEGTSGAVAQMQEWLRKTGSPHSHVTKAVFKNECEIEEYSFKDFSIRH